MIQNLLSDVRRENFGAIANELMNHYCVLKHDSRYDSDLIFRFAEIEFYLYDASAQKIRKGCLLGILKSLPQECVGDVYLLVGHEAGTLHLTKPHPDYV